MPQIISKRLFDWAIKLIKNNKAYVESQSSQQIAEQKGTPTLLGQNSPFRDRSIEENLESVLKNERRLI